MNRSFRGPQRSLQQTREKEDELALFREMRRREKERDDLLHGSEEFDDPLGPRQGASPIFDIPTSAPTWRTGTDDFLNYENDKNDYDWLITPPGTPLFPSLEMETQRAVRDHIETPKASPTSLQSRLAHPLPEPPTRTRLVSKQAASTPGLNTSSTGVRRPSSSGGPGSRPSTPTGRPTLTSTSKPTPANASKSISLTKSTTITTSKSMSSVSKSSSPTVSTKPARSSTPTSRSTLPSTKPTVPPRSSTPLSRTTARSSTPTSRPTMPASKPPSRSATPTRRPATVSTPTSSSAPPVKSTSSSDKPPFRSATPTRRPAMLSTSTNSSAPPVKPASSSDKPPTRSATPTRRPAMLSTSTNSSAPPVKPASSSDKPPTRSATPTRKLATLSTSTNSSAPPVKSASSSVNPRTWNPSGIPGMSYNAPPNLRTSLTDRPISTTRGRPAVPAARSSSLEPVSNGKIRRQSCSPSRGRAPNGVKSNIIGGSVPAVSRIHAKANESISPALVGTKMVERVINMRRLVPPKHDDKQSPRSNLSGKSLSPDSSGFGRSFSKKSLDMAVRHMDIRKTVQGNMRPLMTNIPASSMYSVRPGPTRSKTISVSDSPLATSSTASSEMSVNNNGFCVDRNELEDEINSEKCARSAATIGGK